MRRLPFGEFPARGIAPRIGLITHNKGNAVNAKRLKLLPLLMLLVVPGVAGAGPAARMNLLKTKPDPMRDVIAQGLAAH